MSGAPAAAAGDAGFVAVARRLCRIAMRPVPAAVSCADIARACAPLRPDFSNQIQAGLVVVLSSSCVFCDEGIDQTHALVSKLFMLASANSERRAQNMLETFMGHVVSLKDRAIVPQAGVLLASVADHSRASTYSSSAAASVAVITGEEPPARRRRGAAVAAPTDAQIVRSAVETFSSVNAMAALWPLVGRKFDDVDWLAVAINHSSVIGSLASLPHSVKMLPATIAACARLAEVCGRRLEPRAVWLACAAVAVLVTKTAAQRPYKGSCIAHAPRGGAVCIRDVSMGDRLALELLSQKTGFASILGWSNEARRRSAGGDPAFCCGNRVLSASISKSARQGDVEKLERSVNAVFVVVERRPAAPSRPEGPHRAVASSSSSSCSEDERSDDGGGRPDGRATAHLALPAAKRFRGKVLQRAAAEDISAPEGGLFSAPFVFLDLWESIPRNRMSTSPRMFFCVLRRPLRDGARVVLEAGRTALVRGPFYRHIDSGEFQTKRLLSGARQMAYLNDFKRRAALSGVDAIPVCFMVRAPVPGIAAGALSASSSSSASPAGSADFIDAALGRGGPPRSEPAAPDLAYPDLAIESIRVSDSQATGFLPCTTCERDIDGSLPLWLVMSDITGDYRLRPWRLGFNANRSDLSVSMEKMQRHVLTAETYLPVHAVNEIDLETIMQGERSLRHPHPWISGHMAARGCRASDAMCYRLLMAMAFRAAFGVCRTNTIRDLFATDPTRGAEPCVYMPCDFVYAESRYPEFDAAKRVSLYKTFNASLPARPLFVRGSFLSRAERAARVLKELREVTVPFARQVCAFFRRKQFRRDAVLPLSAKRMVARLTTTLGYRSRDAGGNRRFCGLFNPSNGPASWYPVIGTHFYMAARALGLDPRTFGVDPMDAFGHVQWVAGSRDRTERQITSMGRYFRWARSICEGVPMWNTRGVPDEDADIPIFGMRADRLDVPRYADYDPARDRGWFCVPENARRVERTLEMWGEAVAAERRRILAELGQGEGDESDPPAPGAVEGRPKRPRERSRADADTRPDPEWVAQRWLPDVERACASMARAIRAMLERDEWWDVLEWMHGKNAVELYLIKLNKYLVNCYNHVVRTRRDRKTLGRGDDAVPT